MSRNLLYMATAIGLSLGAASVSAQSDTAGLQQSGAQTNRQGSAQSSSQRSSNTATDSRQLGTSGTDATRTGNSVRDGYPTTSSTVQSPQRSAGYSGRMQNGQAHRSKGAGHSGSGARSGVAPRGQQQHRQDDHDEVLLPADQGDPIGH